MYRVCVQSLVIVCCLCLVAPAASRETGNDAELLDLRERLGQNPGRMQAFLRDVAKLMEQEDIDVRRDIVYSDRKGVPRERRQLDLYLARESDPQLARESDRAALKPIVLYAHGGGWVGGSKAQALFKPVAFVPARFVFASINYRFRPEASVAEMAQSVADAAGWLTRHAEEFGGDASQLFLIGHSAGAHLVSLLGTNAEFLRAAGVALHAVRGIVSLDTAVYNLPRLMKDAGRVHKLVFDGAPESLRAVSPWHHVTAGAAIPPFLIFYSEGRPAAQTQTLPFGARLRAAGYEAEVLEAVGRDHGTLDNRIGTPEDKVTELILDFFDTHRTAGARVR